MAKPKADDESASVRIDLESTAAPVPDAPSVTSASNNGVILLLGAVVLLVVGIAFFILRPEGNAAADGTIREAPTTTIDAPAPGGDLDDPAQATAAEAPELVFPDEATLVPTLINSPETPTSIVSADFGFIGLVRGRSLTPTIVRSVDGQDWRVVETTASSLGTDNLVERQWFRLTNEGGQLQVFGSGVVGDPGVFKNDVFASDNGAMWEQVEGVGSLGGPALPELPAVVGDDGYISTGFGKAEVVDRFLNDHTNLPLDTAGGCFLTNTAPETADGQVSLIVRDCLSGEQEFVLDGSVVESSFSADVVLGCASALAFLNFDNALISQEIGGDQQRTVLDNFIGGIPTPLRGGGVALVDVGVSVLQDVERCNGLAQVSSGSEAAVLIANSALTESVRWPFPEEAPQSDPVFPSLVVGDVVRPDFADRLLVDHQNVLWELNLETGVWNDIVPLLINPTPLNARENILAMADSANVLYIVTGETLAIFDFDTQAGDDSSENRLFPDVSVLSIESPASSFDPTAVLYADDDAIFVRSGDDVWLVPPIS